MPEITSLRCMKPLCTEPEAFHRILARVELPPGMDLEFRWALRAIPSAPLCERHWLEAQALILGCSSIDSALLGPGLRRWLGTGLPLSFPLQGTTESLAAIQAVHGPKAVEAFWTQVLAYVDNILSTNPFYMNPEVQASSQVPTAELVVRAFTVEYLGKKYLGFCKVVVGKTALESRNAGLNLPVLGGYAFLEPGDPFGIYTSGPIPTPLDFKEI